MVTRHPVSLTSRHWFGGKCALQEVCSPEAELEVLRLGSSLNNFLFTSEYKYDFNNFCPDIAFANVHRSQRSITSWNWAVK